MALSDYQHLEHLLPFLPASVALLVTFLTWVCIRLLEKRDKDEDDTLHRNIKERLNPDKLKTMQSTPDGYKLKKEEVDVSLEPVLRKAAAVRLERQMSEDEKEKERRIQQEQLQQIFNLMEADKDKYGVESFGDVQEQLKRYKTE